jgi:hypothetical protein
MIGSTAMTALTLPASASGAMTAQVTSRPDDPARAEDVQVYEVHAEA